MEKVIYILTLGSPYCELNQPATAHQVLRCLIAHFLTAWPPAAVPHPCWHFLVGRGQPEGASPLSPTAQVVRPTPKTHCAAGLSLWRNPGGAIPGLPSFLHPAADTEPFLAMSVRGPHFQVPCAIHSSDLHTAPTAFPALERQRQRQQPLPTVSLSEGQANHNARRAALKNPVPCPMLVRPEVTPSNHHGLLQVSLPSGLEGPTAVVLVEARWHETGWGEAEKRERKEPPWLRD